MSVPSEVSEKVTVDDLNERIREKASVHVPSGVPFSCTTLPAPQRSMWQDEIANYWFLIPLYAAGLVSGVLLSIFGMFRT